MKLEFPVERDGLLSPEWLAESVRLTLFPLAPQGPLPLWHNITGSQPSQTSERPADGFRSEFGDFGAGVLFVHQLGGRIDIQYAAKPPAILVNQVPSQPDLLHIGPGAAAVAALFNLLDSAHDLFEGVFRLAFGPIFVRRGASNPDVISYILEHVTLPVREGDTDILWQVNRPRKAETFDGTINRLSKWQTGSLFPQQIPIMFGQAMPLMQMAQNAINFARVELDINTLHDGKQESFKEPLKVMMEILACSRDVLLGKGD